MSDFDFSSFVDVTVSSFGSRLRAEVVVGDQRIRSVGRSLADFAPDIVDLLVSEKVAGVRLLTSAAEDLGEVLEKVSEARDLIREGLGQREQAVRSVVGILSPAGFTHADIARVVGVSSSALRSLIRDSGTVWGSSALGSPVASLAGGSLVVGAWCLDDAGYLVVASDVLITAVDSAVQQEFFEVTGLEPAADDEETSDSEVEADGAVDVEVQEIEDSSSGGFFDDEESSAHEGAVEL